MKWGVKNMETLSYNALLQVVGGECYCFLKVISIGNSYTISNSFLSKYAYDDFTCRSACCNDQLYVGSYQWNGTMSICDKLTREMSLWVFNMDKIVKRGTIIIDDAI